jgi:hypothetical protein
MRKIIIALLLITATASQAQLNNSWIDYNKTYYKFKLGKTGLYRINQSLLSSLGLTNTPAEYFQLWRNGEQVRMYTSVPSGPFSTNDYIEFWGKMNDGVPDKELYMKPTYQMCDSFSLHTDTASYFLTVNPFPGNLRYNNTNNDIAGNALPPDAYFFRTVAQPYRQQYNRGYAVFVGEFVYSCSYDMGEGWTSYDAAPCCDIFKQFDNLNVYTAGPANGVSLHISAFGNALNTRNLRVKFFNTVVVNSPMNFFDTIKKRIDNLPLSLLSNPNSLLVAVNGTSTNVNDRVVLSNLAVTYPATFNFNGEKNFYFELQPNTSGNFIEITNFNYGSQPPVLYSLNDGRRYTGDIAVAGKVRFALPASTDNIRKFILVNEDADNVATINSAISKTFINYSLSANQGNYLMISHPSLYNDGNGNDYVDQYKQYRASATGGSFKPIVVSIDELTDQFAFGIKQHPAAIRNFIKFAYQQFNPKPEFVLLVGKGITSIDYKNHENDPMTLKLDLVPTFGWPASDILLACEPGKNVPLIPIGRISAVNGTEVKNYLNKVKEYEQVQSTTSAYVADKAWMKNVIHVIGGADSSENAQFKGYMDNYKRILQDSLMGARVETFEKTSTSAIEQANGERIAQLVNEGVTEIGYFGHSSANTLAFNLSSPDIYNNKGRYSFFNVSGCSAGNFFSFDPQRLSGTMSISEKYVLADQRGSIAFLASTSLGIPPFLNFYNTQLHTAMSRDMYGNTLGRQVKKVLEDLGSNQNSLDFYTRIHLEQINLHGDPAIRINHFDLPDFAIEDPLVKLTPNVVTVADNSFSLKVKVMNLGRAVNDSIRISIKRKLPNDSLQVVYNQLVPAPSNADSLLLTVPVNPLTDKGLNTLIISIDADNRVVELYETNNDLTKEFYIFEDEVRPVIPYNFSIVNQQNITFTASTANPLSEVRQYLMEVDTTEQFNSPLKKQYTSSGTGGIIQFASNNFTFADSTVYYWRTSMVPVDGSQPVWNVFSFIYLAGSSTGFNQSHYYQHTKSTFGNTIALDGDGIFRYKTTNRNLQIKTGVYPYTPYDRINVTLDFQLLETYGCKYGSLQFYVYDSLTMQPWKNFNETATNGRFGSAKICSKPTRNFFEFPYNDPVSRKKAMDFLDSIPAGMYVSITNLGWTTNTSFVNDWKADTATLGSGKSLYHKLMGIGFTKIDSFTTNLPFIYFFRKSTPSYTPYQLMGKAPADELEGNFPVPLKYKTGTIESPAFGPAKNWTALHWRGKSIDTQPGDTVNIEVYGIKANGTRTLMATVRPATDTSLAFINAATYPYIKLKMQNDDSKNATPNQLLYWRINADYIPEGAVAPNLLYSMKDSVEQGEKIDFALAFKNISTVAFDSLKIKFTITDRNNVSHIIILPKAKPLLSGDTLIVRYSIDTKNYPGVNTLNVFVNPDNDQTEQYLYNNFIFKEFYVKEDLTSPLLDVTFDGVHILNKDIVAAKPHILVKLKDESKFMALSDTTVFSDISVRYPDLTVHRFYFSAADGALHFNPANISGGDNTASIDFNPYFEQDGDYELIVSGKDEKGNAAGNFVYRIAFTVINKAMISNLLNYPNPFTTSTAFVFTVTGSEVPQNIRIQILTITGKIVREITKADLGDLHIGRNITDFKWDGTDMYGQKLANGVYLYRVITNNNGKSLEKYKAEGDNTDQYFKGGYGKMYLMR